MKLAIIVLAKHINIELKKYISFGCEEIITNEPSIKEYATKSGIPFVEFDSNSYQTIIEYADYVIIFANRNSREMSSFSSACHKYSTSHEVVYCD